MSHDNTFRRFHARVLVRRPKGVDYLLRERDFRFAADCERMRVDRNGSVLSMLLISLPASRQGASDVRFLARLLEGRLRTTDTPGRLDDGRIAILLPDTTPEGAWKVATDVSEIYPPGPDRPECDVLVYPPRRRKDGALVEADVEPLADALSLDTDAADPGETFFARDMSRWKRAVDILGAVVGLGLTAPVIALSAVAVKATSPGPIFFSQEREGLGGRRFQIWKVRTMRHDAEDHKSSLLERSEQDGPAFKMRRDPRTTAVGRFLRWWSFDELPQFWNVLRGEMSLVGPRPLPTAESQACLGWQRRRLDVMPGMTCIWQVRGRGRARFDDWVRMDLEYVKTASPWEDAKLLALTVPSVFINRGMR